MEAIKLTVGFREWDKLDDFVEAVNTQDDVMAYAIDYTTALLVGIDEPSLERITLRLPQWFADYTTETIKK